MDHKDDDNVIQFPKIKKRKNQTSGKVVYALEQNKVMISGSLISILIVMSFFSNSFYKQNPEKQHRSLASTSETNRDTQWEHKLAKKLSLVKMRELASMGKPPSHLDVLKYEELQGKYIVRIGREDNKIKEIIFANSISISERPKMLKDRVGFIQNHKVLFPEYDEVVPVKIHDDRSGETYQLQRNSKNIATVDFRLDKYGHLLQMNVQKSTY